MTDANNNPLLDKFPQLLEGVEYRTLGELGSFYGGLSGKTKEDFKDGNAKFISYKNIYSNPSLNINTDERVKIAEGEKQHIIQYGDILFTGSSETPDECGMSSVLTIHTDEKLYLNSFCFGFRLNDLSLFYPDFLKHLFRSSELRSQIGKTASGTTRFNVSKARFAKVSIPLPPLPVQEEIVRILDKFTTLEAELEAELDCRKRQYEYYRDKLLNKSKSENEYKRVKLGEIGTFTRGRRFVHADDRDEGIPCIHYGELYTHYGVWADKVKTHINPELTTNFRYADKNDVIIVAAGENNVDIGIGVAWLGNEKVAVHDACFIFKHNQNPKFISYALRTYDYHQQIKSKVSQGKICSISADGLANAEIPLPPLDVQERIVNVLDNFEQLCNDLGIGLPAEIEARKKQYEYYRNKLLSFTPPSN